MKEPELEIEVKGDSDAAVALALTQMLLGAEGEPEKPTRSQILETFVLALAAVRGEIELDNGDDEEDEDEDEEDTEDDEEEPATTPAR